MFKLNHKFENKNANKAFKYFLIPSIMTAIAVSLNEFVDGIVVANLIGSHALALVNMAFPTFLILCLVAVLFGNSGAILYSKFIGQQNKNRADQAVSLAVIFLILFSIIVMVVGFFFSHEIAGVLSSNRIQPGFEDLVRILLISAPLIIPVEAFIFLFPVYGEPKYSTLVVFTANILNLIFDIILIKYLSMGVAASALATTMGHFIALIMILVIIKGNKIPFKYTKITSIDKSLITPLIWIGSPPAITQLAFAIKTVFGNHIGLVYEGVNGVTTYAVCFQTLSICGIIITGLVCSIIPLASLMYGQNDFDGIKKVLNVGMKFQLICCVFLFLISACYPKIFLIMYNITNPVTIPYVIHGLLIFSGMYLFRGTIILFMTYAQIAGRKIYALVISIVEGFGGLIIISLLLCPIIGIDGLWWAFTLTEAILFIAMVLFNFIISRYSNILKGFFLLEKENNVLNQVIEFNGEISQEIVEFISDKNIVNDLNSLISEISSNIKGKPSGNIELKVKKEKSNFNVRIRTVDPQPEIQRDYVKQERLLELYYYTWLHYNISN